MARVANWKAPEVFQAVKHQVTDSANTFMDTVVDGAQRRCPVGTITRSGDFVKATVAFTPKTGRNKGKLVKFDTSKRWTARAPGDLIRTIRRVSRSNDRGNTIRVYAGNFKIYWAFMVEHGTASTGWGGPAKAQPFLRPAWNEKKNSAEKDIAAGVII